MPTVSPGAPYSRDRLTWLMYWGMAYYAFQEAILGPIMPFIRDELGLSYTVAGLHLSSMAVGTILGGLSADRLIQRWGRRAAFWGGSFGMGCGTFLLVIGRHPAITILGTWLMGFLGCFLLSTVQAVLSDRHGSQRAIALTEANITSSIVASSSPLLIALYIGIGVGWRGAQITILFLWAITVALRRSQPIPDSPTPKIGQATVDSYRALPRVFWFYLWIVFLLVAIERCLAFWGADFMKNEVGLSKVEASGAIWAFMIGMLGGRVTVSRIAQRTPTPKVLLISTGVACAGFPIFWLSPIPLLNLIGLFITGLGVGNFFPLSMSLAISAAPDRANVASVRALFGSGSATLIAPQVLGWIADQTSIGTAFGLVFVILLLGAMAIILANRQGSRHNDALVL